MRGGSAIHESGECLKLHAFKYANLLFSSRSCKLNLRCNMHGTETMRRIILFLATVSIIGAQVKTVGNYMSIGSTQAVSATVVASTVGQCIGILCGVTHAN